MSTTTPPEVLAIWAESYSLDIDNFIMGDRDSESGLPWDTIPEDLAHFREATRNRLLIMGRNTFEKLPASMTTLDSLAERPIAVLTTDPEALQEANMAAVGAGLDFYNPSEWRSDIGGLRANLNALAFLAGGKDIAIIGGAPVIELFESVIDRLLVTFVDSDAVLGGTVLAPSLDWGAFKSTARIDLTTGTSSLTTGTSSLDDGYFRYTVPYVLESVALREPTTEPTA